MDLFDKYHGLALTFCFLIFTLVQGCENHTFAIFAILMTYTVYKSYETSKKVPDIRSEVKEILKQHNSEFVKLSNKLESEQKEIIAKVSSVAASRAIGASGSSFKF